MFCSVGDSELSVTDVEATFCTPIGDCDVASPVVRTGGIVLDTFRFLWQCGVVSKCGAVKLIVERRWHVLVSSANVLPMESEREHAGTDNRVQHPQTRRARTEAGNHSFWSSSSGHQLTSCFTSAHHGRYSKYGNCVPERPPESIHYNYK